jgi:ferric-dicitrate binding protein FerR (iron transport regulator)
MIPQLMSTLLLFNLASLAPAESTSPAKVQAGIVRRIDQKASADMPPGAQPTVAVSTPAGGRRIPVSSPIYAGERMITQAEQTATVTLSDGTELTIGPSSELFFEQVRPSDAGSTLLRLTQGSVRSRVQRFFRGTDHYDVTTPSAAMRTQRAEFLVEHSKASETSTLQTFEGSVTIAQTAQELTNAKKSVSVAKGMMTSIKSGSTRAPAVKKLESAKPHSK